MSDRIARIVIDPSAGEQGAARAVKAFNSIGTSAKAAARNIAAAFDSADIDKIGTGADNAASATAKMAQSAARSATASRNRASALDAEADRQSKLSKMIDDSVGAYERQRKAAYDAYQARLQSDKATGGKVDTSGVSSAKQNTMMGLGADGKIAADVLNGTKDLGKAAADVKKVEDGVKKVGTALHGSAGAFREVIVLAREAGRGDFTRMAGSASILFQRLGGIEAVGVPLLATLAGVGAVVGIVAAAMVKGGEEANQFSNQLKLTGNFAGLTSSSYLQMATDIGKATSTSIASNEELISSLSSKNAFTKEEIDQLVTSAQTLSRATGESATDIVADFEKMADGPAKYAASYADKYAGVITPAQVAHIKLLEDTGQKSEALKELINDVNGGIARSTQENTGYIVRAWNSVTNAISDAWTRLKQFGAAEVPGQKIARIQGEIADAKASNYGMQSQLPRLQQELAAAQAEQAGAEKRAAAQAEHTRMMREGNQAAQELSSTYGNLIDSQSRYNNDVAKLRRTVDATLKANPNDANALNINAHWDAAKAKLRKQDMPEQVKADNKADREAESAAKREAREEAERQKRAEDFLKTLDAQGKAASETPIQAEITTKTQQLENILAHKLTDSAADRATKERIVNDVIAERQGKLTQELQKTNDAAQADIDTRTKALGLTDREQAIADAERAEQTKALDAVGDKTNAQIELEIKRAGAIAAQNYDLEQQAKILDKIGQLSETAAQADKLRDLGNQQKALDSANTVDASGTSALQRQYGVLAKQVYNEASTSLKNSVVETSDYFHEKFADAIDDLGQQLGGSLGKAVSDAGNALKGVLAASSGDFTKSGPLGALATIIGKNSDGSQSDFATGFQGGSQSFRDSLFGTKTQPSAIADPLKSLTSGFKGFSDDVRGIFGKGGNLTKSLGDVAGKAAAGFQMGQTTDSILKALGAKSSKLGAELGGAVGSAVAGPIGGLIGSIGGGLLGGLFKKVKYGTDAVSVNSYGNVAADDATGNSGKAKAASTEGATGVASGLNSIASALGASITGTANVSIGTYDGKWRVSDTGRTGKLKTKYSDVTDFGKDGEADAVAYAIKVALKQGVLTGLSDFSEQLLKNASDIDAATKLAAQYENVLKDLANFDDPVKAAADTLKKTFETLETQMKANGATAADLANVERDYTLQKEAALKTQLSDLEDFKAKLNGEDSGATSMDRYQAALDKFRSYEGDISAGKTVDQSDFATAGSNLFDVAKEVFGTAGSQFQDIRAEESKYNDLLETNIKGVFGASNDNGSSDVVTAVQQTNSQLDAANVIATQQLQALTAIQASLTATITGGSGRLSASYVNGVSLA